jgi:hypothetical protein
VSFQIYSGCWIPWSLQQASRKLRHALPASLFSRYLSPLLTSWIAATGSRRIPAQPRPSFRDLTNTILKAFTFIRDKPVSFKDNAVQYKGLLMSTASTWG